MTAAVAAVDLGATSGRVMLGYVNHNELRLVPISRFPNHPVRQADGLHWDLTGLYRHALDGLAAATRQEPGLVSIGVDSWAVDYALLAGGRTLGEPFHYRDERTAAGVQATEALVDRAELYAANGLQFLPFTTLYQLAADRISGRLDQADTFLLVPDLINFWLTGEQFAEKTNASTTGLLDPRTGRWNDTLIGRLALPRAVFPPLVDSGARVGALLPDVARQLGIPRKLTVHSVASHDTASAVVAIPAATADFAYISSGTWSLVGVELEHPVLTDAGRIANFTNEGGVDGRIRYLKNVMGLWLLNESVGAWEAASGDRVDLPQLLQQAAEVDRPVAVFDVNDDRFLPPGDMPARIEQLCRETGLPVPTGRAELVRSMMESLAAAYADAVAAAHRLTGKNVAIVHLVGGGSQNALLCQLTADRTGMPVIAGPVEATAIGNVLIQARAHGRLVGDLETLRALVLRSVSLTRYLPRTALHDTAQ
ncbi:rhamnulokinase family protein [Salinibacterium sp. ZJ450]|uniref:rhamnulokinase n=1 Tax=Salinibacterium sp. ZJ450 TaxID=2708338 RepID=UPI0014235EB3|nr:rhamnulokinase family protein [Salinibacterium sp. ZJ450]